MNIRTSALPSRAWRLLLATLVVAVAATLSQTAWAMPGGHGGHGAMGLMADGRHIERVLDAVNATAEQRSQIKTARSRPQAA
jgi:Spy/CpxP family protein refolding chaperone